MTESDLIGVWELVSFHDVDDKGNRHEGPLGPRPRGLLFYSVDGHVSVSMMSTEPSAVASADVAGHPRRTYLSYAGTWRVDGAQVFHAIDVAPDPELLGGEHARDMILDGDRLTLYGRALIGRPQLRVLEWRRSRAEG